MIKRVKVKLSGRPYDILVGPGAVRSIVDTLPAGGVRSRIVVVSDKRLRSQRTLLLKELRRSHREVIEIPVAAGEKLKDFSRVLPIYGELLKGGVKRDSVLVALGGGTIGDAAGFVASTYMRGIPWIGVPTTLLAQVDSSIGGKTAVNHQWGKNLIGTFAQPAAVICDIAFLKTLKKRDLISGLGEVIKYGIIYDPPLFQFMRRRWTDAANGDLAALSILTLRSARWKAKIVAQDEFDKKGVREFLNFGHTFGHALESATGYARYQHGEAVIWGMRFALALSLVKKLMAAAEYEKIDSFLRILPIPPLPSAKFNKYFAPMTRDKKVRAGKIHFVLLKKLGSPVSHSAVSRGDLNKAYDLMRTVSRRGRS